MKKKTFSHIKNEERLEIAILLNRKYSIREISRVLQRSHTALSREIKRNKVKGVYDPQKAQHKAQTRRKSSKYQGMKIRKNPVLEKYIEKKIKKSWSPKSISGRLKNHDTHLPYASHRVIYKYLRSVYGQPLCQYLRSKRYYGKKRKFPKPKREIIRNRTFIDQRPDFINKREDFGHFEADRIESNKHSLAGLVVAQERKSRYYLAKKTHSRKPEENKNALREAFQKISSPKSITYDSDIAFTKHEEVNQLLGTRSFFCFPHHPWEKGGVENANKIMREFIPKGSDIAQYSQEEIDEFVEIINNRPRECLNYKTPEEVVRENGLLRKVCYLNLNTLELLLKQKTHRQVVHLRV